MFDALLVPNAQVASWVILRWLGQALLFGTALAILTWPLIRLLPRRRHTAFEVALWSVVLLKFLVPFGPANSFSLESLCVNVIGYQPGSLVAGDPAAAATALRGSAAEASAPAGSVVAPAAWDWRTSVAAVYLATVFGLLMVRVRGYRKLAAQCCALPAADKATCDIVDRVCRRFRLRRVPPVRVDDQSSTTFMIGLFRPLIVISGRQLARPSELETVIVHEVAHLKRGDMLVRCLQWVVSTLLFFWPVVAWVNRRIDEAREYACDDWALCHGKLTAGEYARCLLNAIQPMRMAPLAYRPPCMAGHPSTIERRINMVLKTPDRPARGRTWGLAAVVLVLTWGGFALTGAVDAGPKKVKHAQKKWPAAEEAFKAHLDEVMNQVGEYEVADLDGNGELSYWEKTAFVTTLALSQADALLETYSYADFDRDGELHITEACNFVRGLTLTRSIEKQAKLEHKAAVAKGKDEKVAGKAIKMRVNEERLAALHEALDAQQWLLARMTIVPDIQELETNDAFIMETFAKKEKKGDGHDTIAGKKKVDELRAKMADIRDQLTTETDDERIAKLEGVLKKLEHKTQVLKTKLAEDGQKKVRIKKRKKG